MSKLPTSNLTTDWLESIAGVHPGAPALHLLGETLDYASLLERVEVLAASLQRVGISTGSTIALVSESTPFIAQMVHAAPLLGCTLFPVDPKLPHSWRNRLLVQAGVNVVLCDGLDSPLPATVTALAIETLPQEPGSIIERKDIAPLEVQLIVATSGSSGEPKGVMLSPANLSASVKAANEQLGLRAGDCWLDCLPLFHIGGLSILFRAAAAGASVALHQGFDAATVWADLKRRSATHVSLVPAMLAKLLDEADGKPPPETLRVLLVGGDALSPNLAKHALEAGWPLWISYGMSETASQVATRCMVAGSEAEHSDVGKPLDGFEIRLVDEKGGPSDGDTGRVYIRGKAVMLGYANPGHYPGDGVENGWLESGDLGRLDESGKLTIIGRADEVLVTGGENIHPVQVEERLRGCAGVDEVAVIGKPDPVWGEVIVAIYVGNIDEQRLDQWCREHIDGALRPRGFVRSKSLPRLANGKIDRKALRQGSC